MWPAAMWSDAPISKKSSCRCASNGVAFCLSAAWPTPSGVASVGVRVCDAVSLAAAGGDAASPVLPLFFPLPSSSSYFLLLFWADTHHRGACERRTRGFPGRLHSSGRVRSQLARRWSAACSPLFRCVTSSLCRERERLRRSQRRVGMRPRFDTAHSAREGDTQAHSQPLPAPSGRALRGVPVVSSASLSSFRLAAMAGPSRFSLPTRAACIS